MQIEISDELYARIVDLAARPAQCDDSNFEAREIWTGDIATPDDEGDACYRCYEAGVDDGYILLSREIVECAE